MLTFHRAFISEVPAGASIIARETGTLSFGPVDKNALTAYIVITSSRQGKTLRLTAKPNDSLTYRSATAYRPA